jgi:hypothetical protein
VRRDRSGMLRGRVRKERKHKLTPAGLSLLLERDALVVMGVKRLHLRDGTPGSHLPLLT